HGGIARCRGKPAAPEQFSLWPSDATARRAARTKVASFGLLRSWATAGPDSTPSKTGVSAMAHPIALDAPVRDPHIELQRRLEDAPAEHAAALLAGYEVLQGLQDSGALDLMRGALGSRDQVLSVAVQATAS